MAEPGYIGPQGYWSEYFSIGYWAEGAAAVISAPSIISALPQLGRYTFVLRVKDRNGNTKRHAVTDFLWLDYRIDVNGAGRIEFGLGHNSDLADELEEFDQVEVWWANPSLGVTLHRDFSGIYRDGVWDTRNDMDQFAAKGHGDLGILDFRHNMYPAGLEGKSKFTDMPVETVLKRLVILNCTGAAVTTNDRIKDGNMLNMGFDVRTQPDSGRGNVIDKGLANGRLLASMEDIVEAHGGYIRMVKSGSNIFELRYYDQIGADKSSGSEQIQFSLTKGNMLDPTLEYMRRNKRTSAVVGGQGRGNERVYAVVYSDDYSAANDIELFVSATNESTLAGLEALGKEKLEEVKALDVLSFGVLQTPQVFYSRQDVAGKRTYTEGTIVSALHRGRSFRQQIRAVTVSVRPSDGGDREVSVSVELEDV